MRILRGITVLAAFIALVSSCKDKPPELPQVSETMPDIPLPPRSSVVSRAGSEDALQITFQSSLPPDSLVAHYRRVLTSGEWTLVGDTRTADGAVALYAERAGPPLWVTIRKDSTSSGTLLTLGGAVVPSHPDSAATPDSTKPS
jgi:hypothetical protein